MMVNASDIKTLFDTKWLNDKVVYIYFRIIHASCSWISVVDPMFITALNDGRSSAAKKYLTPQHLQANQVLIPCILEGHWTLIVLDVAGKTMTLVDSGNARDIGLTLVSHFFESMDEMPHS
ncbi:uncharacterized protein LOC127837973 [Dreissena polymorpha]|uniref:uncharacterized protein LOC127837973 n=1 Tax=Dreissena polymorpha TaxID=45954 RepID=UPI00226510FD|nr:uncharacterized protein LOC127837973 [Dreissena polymorpha]